MKTWSLEVSHTEPYSTLQYIKVLLCLRIRQIVHKVWHMKKKENTEILLHYLSIYTL